MSPLSLPGLDQYSFSTQLSSNWSRSSDPETAAKEFEAVYLSTVFDRMFESVNTDGPFGGGKSEATWRSFLADEYAGEVTRQGGIGLADAVRAELVGLQEAFVK